MKKIIILFVLLLIVACQAAPMRNRETGALTGGALGAGLGAIVGHETGNTGAGVAIGAGIGALSGALVGNSYDNQEDRLDQQQSRIQNQDREIAENRRMIDELKSRGLDAYGSKRGVIVNLPDVLFEFNSAKVTSEAVSAVKDIYQVVKDYPERRISVEGHTDSIGTIAYNKTLSENRAASVTDELVAQGISRRRITSVGYGESDPIASNRSEEGRSRNRRVEVVIK